MSAPIVDTTLWTRGQTIPQIVFTLGVIGYTAFGKRRFPHHVHMHAGFEFDHIVALAKQRGFKRRRQLIGSVRYGRPTEFAMARIAEVCALITEDEIRERLARLSAWMHFCETGRMPPGWTIRTSTASPHQSPQ